MRSVACRSGPRRLAGESFGHNKSPIGLCWNVSGKQRPSGFGKGRAPPSYGDAPNMANSQAYPGCKEVTAERDVAALPTSPTR